MVADLPENGWTLDKPPMYAVAEYETKMHDFRKIDVTNLVYEPNIPPQQRAEQFIQLLADDKELEQGVFNSLCRFLKIKAGRMALIRMIDDFKEKKTKFALTMK